VESEAGDLLEVRIEGVDSARERRRRGRGGGVRDARFRRRQDRRRL